MLILSFAEHSQLCDFQFLLLSCDFLKIEPQSSPFGIFC